MSNFISKCQGANRDGKSFLMDERPHTQAEINEYRRRSLIDATLRSLSENGVSGTTVRSICGGSAGSRGLIAHYYDGKEGLLAAAFSDLLRSTDEIVRKSMQRQGDDPVAQLKAFPRSLFSPTVFTDINRGAYLTFWHEMRFNPAVRKVNSDFYRGYSLEIERMFAKAANELEISIEAAGAAQGLIAMTDGFWLELSINSNVISRKKAIVLCSNFIDLQLR